MGEVASLRAQPLAFVLGDKKAAGGRGGHSSPAARDVLRSPAVDTVSDAEMALSDGWVW